MEDESSNNESSVGLIPAYFECQKNDDDNSVNSDVFEDAIREILQ